MGKRQGQTTIEQDGWSEKNGGSLEPDDRGNVALKNGSQENQHHQDQCEAYHRVPEITKTSSTRVRSTAGSTVATPSSSLIANPFTVPTSTPEGNTPPVPEVNTFIPCFTSAVFLMNSILSSHRIFKQATVPL